MFSTEGATMARMMMMNTAYSRHQYCGMGPSYTIAGVSSPPCACKYGPTIMDRWFNISILYDFDNGNITVDGAECSFQGTPGLTPAFMRFGNTNWGLACS